MEEPLEVFFFYFHALYKDIIWPVMCKCVEKYKQFVQRSFRYAIMPLNVGVVEEKYLQQRLLSSLQLLLIVTICPRRYIFSVSFDHVQYIFRRSCLLLK
jgi:hypothetical protein